MLRTLTLAVLAGAFAATAQAQTPTTVPVGDEYFAMKAYCEGNAEVAKSKLAEQKASDPEVKKFAMHMVKDHTAVNGKIATLANKKGIALPTTLDPVSQAGLARMATLSGSDFDKAYMMGQIHAHKDALNLFEHEAHKGMDSELKGLATKSVPDLMAHAKMAFEVAGESKEGEKFEKVMDYKKKLMNDEK